MEFGNYFNLYEKVEFCHVILLNVSVCTIEPGYVFWIFVVTMFGLAFPILYALLLTVVNVNCVVIDGKDERHDWENIFHMSMKNITMKLRLFTLLILVSCLILRMPEESYGTGVAEYDHYLGIIRNKMESRWSLPIAYSQVKQTLIEFMVHRNGEIDNITVFESSGDQNFDQMALRAVSLSNPFPPLPRDYKEEFLEVRSIFVSNEKGEKIIEVANIGRILEEEERQKNFLRIRHQSNFPT